MKATNDEPLPGDVWGVPGKPLEWYLVHHVSLLDGAIFHTSFRNNRITSTQQDDWDKWVQSGARLIKESRP